MYATRSLLPPLPGARPATTSGTGTLQEKLSPAPPLPPAISDPPLPAGNSSVEEAPAPPPKSASSQRCRKRARCAMPSAPTRRSWSAAWPRATAATACGGSGMYRLSHAVTQFSIGPLTRSGRPCPAPDADEDAAPWGAWPKKETSCQAFEFQPRQSQVCTCMISRAGTPSAKPMHKH